MTGVPPKPNAKLFMQIEGVVNVLLAPPSKIEEAELVCKNLEKHWGSMTRSVVYEKPDDSFFIDHAKTYSTAFIATAKQFCLLPNDDEKKKKCP